MLKWTGHPLVDVGVATVVAFSGKHLPEEVTVEDLDHLAEYLAERYVSGGLTSYLSSVFTMNAVYTQPSWEKEKRASEAAQLLQTHKRPRNADVSHLRCVFSGEPASRLAYRQHIPLLTGEGVLNFFPAGLGGLPIAGPYLLALQALPLGARRCLGRMLAVHSPDDEGLTLSFARAFLQDNRRLMLLSQESEEKYFDAKVPKTLLVNRFLEIDAERRDFDTVAGATSLTAYFLTNDGREPRIDLIHLPSQVISFLRKALADPTRSIWKKIQFQAWQRVVAAEKKRSRKAASNNNDGSPETAAASNQVNAETFKNYLYEDLFDLPTRAARFIRIYFLRNAYRSARAEDPRSNYRLMTDLDLVSWNLTRLFLKEILAMENSRIRAIRDLGDRLAAHIEQSNDKSFFRRFYMLKRYVDFRNLVIKASASRVKQGLPPLAEFDEYLLAFEHPDDYTSSDWSLVRDLLLIRCIEQLHKNGWFSHSRDVLESLEEDTEEASVAQAAAR